MAVLSYRLRITPWPQVGTTIPPSRNIILMPRFATYKAGAEPSSKYVEMGNSRENVISYVSRRILKSISPMNTSKLGRNIQFLVGMRLKCQARQDAWRRTQSGANPSLRAFPC